MRHATQKTLFKALTGALASLGFATTAQAQQLTPELIELYEVKYAEAVSCVGLSQMFDGLESMASGFVSSGLAIDPDERAGQTETYQNVIYLMGVGLGRTNEQMAVAMTDSANGYISRLNAANATVGLTPGAAFFTDEILPEWRACEDERAGAEVWLAAMNAVLDQE